MAEETKMQQTMIYISDEGNFVPFTKDVFFRLFGTNHENKQVGSRRFDYSFYSDGYLYMKQKGGAEHALKRSPLMFVETTEFVHFVMGLVHAWMLDDPLYLGAAGSP